MGDVVFLDGRECDPLDEGAGQWQVNQAQCLACLHEWTAVAETGTVWLDCPSCGIEKGLMVGPCIPDEPAWTCDCGNSLFYMTERGHMCPNCGVYQNYGD